MLILICIICICRGGGALPCSSRVCGAARGVRESARAAIELRAPPEEAPAARAATAPAARPPHAREPLCAPPDVGRLVRTINVYSYARAYRCTVHAHLVAHSFRCVHYCKLYCSLGTRRRSRVRWRVWATGGAGATRARSTS